MENKMKEYIQKNQTLYHRTGFDSKSFNFPTYASILKQLNSGHTSFTERGLVNQLCDLANEQDDTINAFHEFEIDIYDYMKIISAFELLKVLYPNKPNIPEYFEAHYSYAEEQRISKNDLLDYIMS